MVRPRARVRPPSRRTRSQRAPRRDGGDGRRCAPGRAPIRPGARSRWVRSPARLIAHRGRHRYGDAKDRGGAGRRASPGARQGRRMSDERPSDEERHATVYGRKVGERLRASGGRSGFRCRTSRRPRSRSSRRRCSAPTSGASGPSRCPGSSGWPASTTCRSTSSCPSDEGPDFDRRPRSSTSPIDGRERVPDKIAIDLTRLESSSGPTREMLGPLPRDDPGPAAGLQRPGAHDPPRRPARHRLHPRRRRPTQPPPPRRPRAASASALIMGPDGADLRRLRPHPVLRAAVRLLRVRARGPTACT